LVSEVDISKVFMAHGVVIEGIHGLKDLGFLTEIKQSQDLFKSMKGKELGMSQGLDIAASGFLQNQESIAVFIGR
jgi:hypothetical protein